ncbi:MAG: hypothetical protein ACFFAX_08605 [Promethearchaeota archaeon]
MKTKINPSQKGKSLLLTFHEGFSTYTIVIPMPYAVKFFVDGLTSALGLLTQKNELQEKLSETEGQKAEIQEGIRKAVSLFEQFLDKTGRSPFCSLHSSELGTNVYSFKEPSISRYRNINRVVS